MQQKTHLNACAGSQTASLLQPVAPVALGALYAALSDKDQCKSLATKGLLATCFLQSLHQLKDDKAACLASVHLQGATREIKTCSIYQPRVLKAILSYVCSTSLEEVRTESYLQAFLPHSLKLCNQNSYITWVSRPV